jgi:hypothetical protein
VEEENAETRTKKEAVIMENLSIVIEYVSQDSNV